MVQFEPSDIIRKLGTLKPKVKEPVSASVLSKWISQAENSIGVERAGRLSWLIRKRPLHFACVHDTRLQGHGAGMYVHSYYAAILFHRKPLLHCGMDARLQNHHPNPRDEIQPYLAKTVSRGFLLTFRHCSNGHSVLHLSALDKLEKRQGEAHSIGLLLCKEANGTTVELAIQDYNKPMGVATYKTSKEIPESYKTLAPVVEGVKKLISKKS